MMGAEARAPPPNRFTFLLYKRKCLQVLIEQEGISLIVTVDNGAAGNMLSLMQDKGVDVIVTDHHSASSASRCLAIVHPEHPDADYPFKYLQVVVVFKLQRLPVYSY